MPEDQLIELSTTDLKPHPMNAVIYGDEDADPELVESIRQNEQLEPLVINKNYVIISGHRRWMALKTLNKPAKCRVMDFKDELDEREAIVEFNRQREKVPSQIYNEVKTLHNVYSQRANQRQISGLKHQEIVPLNSAERGDARDNLARAVGIKRDKLEKIIDICEKAESGDDVAIRTLRKLDSGEVTVYGAYTQVRINEISKLDTPQSKYAGTLLPKVESGEITSNQAMKKINEYKEPIQKPAKKPVKPPRGTYNIILAEPPLPLENFMEYRVPAAEDSVLYLWSTVQNLKQSLEVMAWWNFQYRSMIFWDQGNNGSGDWVTTSSKLLLIGTRGDLTAPETKCSGTISGKKTEFAYEIIEKMFPSQKYAELFVENHRESWNVDQNESQPEPSQESDNTDTTVFDVAQSPLEAPIETQQVIEVTTGTVPDPVLDTVDTVEKLQPDNTPEEHLDTPFVLCVGTRDMGVFEQFNNHDPGLAVQCQAMPKKQDFTELWDNRKHERIFTFDGEWSPERIVETADKKINEYLDYEEHLPPYSDTTQVTNVNMVEEPTVTDISGKQDNGAEEIVKEKTESVKPEATQQTQPEESELVKETVKEAEIKEPVKARVQKAKKDVKPKEKPTTSEEKKTKQNYTQYDSQIPKCVVDKSLSRLEIIDALGLKNRYESLDVKVKHAMEEGIYKRCNVLVKNGSLVVDEITSKEKGSAHYIAKTQS